MKYNKKVKTIGIIFGIFLMSSMLTFSNTAGGSATGFFDGLFNFLTALITDTKTLLVSGGILAIVIGVVLEIFMSSDMKRTIMIVVGGVFCIAIGLNPEKVITFLGGAVIDEKILLESIKNNFK